MTVPPSSIGTSIVPPPRVVPGIIADVGIPVARLAEAVARVSQVQVVREDFNGFAELGALSVKRSALAVGYPRLCGSLFPLLARPEERTCRIEIIECVAGCVGARDSGAMALIIATTSAER